LPLQATRLAVADLNSDGNPDLIVTDFNGTIQAFTGNGDGTFSPGESFVPSYLGVTAVGDFNNDGIPDVALAGAGPAVGFNIAGVSVVLGTGDGTFVLATPHTVPIGSIDRFTTLVSGDFDGDGLPDLAGYFSANTTVPTLEGVAVLLSSTGLQAAKVTNLTSPQ
jgi:FG-GAP-like repeat